jgi:hypothetical protein
MSASRRSLLPSRSPIRPSLHFPLASIEEAELFVNYVFELRGDGESASCAIAVHRGWAIATDDKKAISFIKREASQIQILSTLVSSSFR